MVFDKWPNVSGLMSDVSYSTNVSIAFTSNSADAEDGEVFVCGQNHRGQLGLGHLTDISTLRRCPSLTQTVTTVTCGWDFTLFLTGETLDSGTVW